MNAWWIFGEFAVAALVARWTALLAVAWLAHCVQSGRNPRWRVALWRATVVGIAGVGALTFAPPVLTVPVVPTPRSSVTGSSGTASRAPGAQNPVP